MKYTEEAVTFECAGQRLIGILTKPETPTDTGVVVIVGGPQYRVGSHRQFVLLSRALSAEGFAVLRFDYRGMGDSEGRQRHFESVRADIGAAIRTLRECAPSVRHIVLWGLCDGASAALLYCNETQDPRVTGLCLLNPWVRSEVSLARTHVKHYYLERLRQKGFWIKLISGKLAMSAFSGFVQKLRLASSSGQHANVHEHETFQRRMATAWDAFPGSILLLLSGHDYTAKEFRECMGTSASWKNALDHPRLVRHELQDADHTFSSGASHALMARLTLRWLVTLASDREV